VPKVACHVCCTFDGATVIDAGGCVSICDRTRDLVKSGEEWISSVALENALMARPAVAEAAVWSPGGQVLLGPLPAR
jgi:acyl-coenzyme A synthetase/AMP-(fatty) acid ligase